MINNYVDNKICTGCGACVNSCSVQALSYSADQYGFLMPTLSGDCIQCEKCIKVCPLLNKSKINEGTKAYAAFSLDAITRKDSSSGGIFTLLANEVLKTNGVVYGAAFDSTFSVNHICVESDSQLEQLRGAKYAQSDVDHIYTTIQKRLKSGQSVLFCGTPCQVAGLSSYLGQKYDNLLLIDTVCHSVPSPLAWKKYIEYRIQKDETYSLPSAINMRSKHTGWSDYRYSCVFSYPDDKHYSSLGYEDLFISLFTQGCISRDSCANCRFKGYDRISDITLGDFWGIWDICPEMDDNFGTSLLLVHSEKGQDFLTSIRNSIRIKEMTLNDSSKYNPAILNSTIPDKNRNYYLDKACQGKYDQVNKRLNAKPSLITRIKRRIRP